MQNSETQSKLVDSKIIDDGGNNGSNEALSQ